MRHLGPRKYQPKERIEEGTDHVAHVASCVTGNVSYETGTNRHSLTTKAVVSVTDE